MGGGRVGDAACSETPRAAVEAGHASVGGGAWRDPSVDTLPERTTRSGDIAAAGASGPPSSSAALARRLVALARLALRSGVAVAPARTDPSRLPSASGPSPREGRGGLEGAPCGVSTRCRSRAVAARSAASASSRSPSAPRPGVSAALDCRARPARPGAAPGESASPACAPSCLSRTTTAASLNLASAWAMMPAWKPRPASCWAMAIVRVVYDAAVTAPKPTKLWTVTDRK
mmetsp:Transcript_403/g.1441  ORF Transcript_403/g.1441 Transcript_403/m.1441 type:complete len:231 (-) Transcript_403:477-1169(-)